MDSKSQHDDTLLEELKKKEQVDWSQLSAGQHTVGTIVLAISMAEFALFCLGLFLKLLLPLFVFEKFALIVTFLTVLLVAGCGVTLTYFSQTCGDSYSRTSFNIACSTALPCIVLNVASLVWMLSVQFNTFVLSNVILALAGALLALLATFYSRRLVLKSNQFALYICKGGQKYYLVWNGSYMDLYPKPTGADYSEPGKEDSKAEIMEKSASLKQATGKLRLPACLACTKTVSALRWGADAGENYPHATYTCLVCHKNKQCKEGRWSCKAGCHDVCAECRPCAVPALLPACGRCQAAEGGHSLVWSTSTEGYEARKGDFVCALCGEKGKCEAGRWSCGKDQYDVCAVCRPGTGNLGEVKCPKNHVLLWNVSTELAGDEYECKECKQAFRKDMGRWRCQECDYDICPSEKRPVALLAMCFVGVPEALRGKLLFCQDKKHPLIWSQNTVGYPSQSYTCSVCGQPERSLTVGRWTCGLCKYNVCPECRPAMRAYGRCKTNHPLEWSTNPLGDDESTFRCVTCKTAREYAEGRWTCARCKYSVCSNCRPPVAPSMVEGFVSCGAGHALQWVAEGGKKAAYACAICGRDGNSCAGGRWGCEECKYWVCPVCRPYERLRIELPALSCVCCPKDHLLSWSLEGWGEKFACSVCGSQREVAKGSWTCACDYKVCPQCRPFAQLMAIRAYTECEKTGHPLAWEKDADIIFSCFQCKRGGLSAAEGRWKCSDPDGEHSICKECRPNTFSESVQDLKGHFMLPSASAEESGKSFVCSKCGTLCQSSAGRWTCPQCKDFALCFECRAPTSLLVTRRRNMRCKSGHVISWCCDDTGYLDGEFTCAVCGNRAEAKEGRWTCPCGTDICSGCLRPDRDYCECPAGHGLAWSMARQGYKDGKYMCKICGAGRICQEGRWSCGLCGYDVCVQCRPPVVPAETMKMYTECEKAHALAWMEEGGKFDCSICKTTGLDPAEGRWTCEECKGEYSVCPVCRPTLLNNPVKLRQRKAKEAAEEVEHRKKQQEEELSAQEQRRSQLAADEERFRQTAEEAEKRRIKETETRAAEEERLKRLAEQVERKTKEAEDAERQRQKEDEGKRLAGEERLKQLAEQVERKTKEAAEAEGKLKQQMESERKAQEEKRKELEEMEAKLRLATEETERKQKALEEEKAKHAAEEDAKRKLEEEKRKKEDEENEKKRVAEEARLKQLADEVDQKRRDAEGLKKQEIEARAAEAARLIQLETEKEKIRKEAEEVEIGRKQLEAEKLKKLEEDKERVRVEAEKQKQLTAEKEKAERELKEKAEAETLRQMLEERKRIEQAAQAEAERLRKLKEEEAGKQRLVATAEGEEKKRLAAAAIEAEKRRQHEEEEKKHFEEEKAKQQQIIDKVAVQKVRLVELEEDKESRSMSISKSPKAESERRTLNDSDINLGRRSVDVQMMVRSTSGDFGSVHSPRSSGSMSPTTMARMSDEIQQVFASNQLERAGDHVAIKELGKLEWNKTLFIFAFDCSGSMRGARWNAVKSGYKRCLWAMAKMPNILVTTFSFDDKVYPHMNCRLPSDALKNINKIPFIGKGTNYNHAMEKVVECIESRGPKYHDYLISVIFLADGSGGYPDVAVKSLIKLKSVGTNILFYTIACATEDDAEMQKMAKELQGTHYRIKEQSAAEAIFLRIICS